jgi:hypothetical protein
MTWRIALAACLTATTLAPSPVHACMPALPEPRLAGESDEAYKIRTSTLQRERVATWLKERQADVLRRADTIVIARDTPWSPPYRPRTRGGRPIPPRIEPIPYPAPSYYKPIDWFKGVRTRALFRVGKSMTSCGPMGIGDTTYSQPGNLYVFFARKGPPSEKTLIDAIAVDHITDPALMEFVARYRKSQ